MRGRWWSKLADECPITLEPLAELPYPPFILADRRRRGVGHCDHFDGMALATYVVSQGTFANPLTREPLHYDDCVRLDEYLNDHIYHQKDRLHQANLASVLGQRRQIISVKEAWLLRNSIKVSIDGGGNVQTESQRRRAEALQNEATAALRGLFVFGHSYSNGSNCNDNDWQTVERMSSSGPMPRAPGGYNLHHCMEPNLDHSWGMNSSSHQEGLHIIDDDQAAYEAADVAAWREVQESFPLLSGDRAEQKLPPRHCNDSDASSHLLETVRRTANLTIKEEKEKAAELERNRQRYFLLAMERKRKRIDERRKAKEKVAADVFLEKEAQSTLQSAREEIERWRAQEWSKWEQDASMNKPEIIAKETPPGTNKTKVDIQQSASHNQELSAAEKAEKTAAKKKAKRQKAKERVKEKKRLEKLESEKRCRAQALQKEKENSMKKCGACGEGVLGSGFEKVRNWHMSH